MIPTRGWALRVGDSILVAGRVHRITRLVPYVGRLVDELVLPASTRIAYEDDGTGRPWSLTVVPGELYEVVS